MGGNGIGSGGDGQNGGHPLGTEYTLQGKGFTSYVVHTSDDRAGVMRFLQSEWLRHERDRNVWEIEQAEMKSRIGKLEGDRKTAQRLQNSLQKHVKMLEMALRTERETVRKLRTEGGGLERPNDLKEDDKSATNCKSEP